MEVVPGIGDFPPWQVPALIGMAAAIIYGPRVTFALLNIFTQFSAAVFYQSGLNESAWLTPANAVVPTLSYDGSKTKLPFK